MIIAIDIDDVLADSVSALLDFYNQKYSPKVHKKDLASYGYWGFLGKTREEANKKYFEFTDSTYFDNTKPMPGAQKAIKDLSDKHELVLVTGRPLFLREKTERWVENHFAGLFNSIFFTNDRVDRNNYSPYWGRAKSEICDDIGAEVLVDDLFDYLDGSEHLKVILFDQVWNRAEIKDHIIRAESWSNIAEILL